MLIPDTVPSFGSAPRQHQVWDNHSRTLHPLRLDLFLYCGEAAHKVVMDAKWDARIVYNAVAKDSPFGPFLQGRWADNVVTTLAEAQKEYEAGSPVGSIVEIGPAKKKQLDFHGVVSIGELAALQENTPLLDRIHDYVGTQHRDENNGFWDVQRFVPLAMAMLTHGVTEAQSDSDDDDRQEWQESVKVVIARDAELHGYKGEDEVVL
jgi:hypothetical protein